MVSGLEIRANGLDGARGTPLNSFSDWIRDIANKGEELWGVCDVKSGVIIRPVLAKNDYAIVEYQGEYLGKRTNGKGIYPYGSSVIFDVRQFD